MNANVLKQAVVWVLSLLDDDIRAFIDVTGELFDEIEAVIVFTEQQINPYNAVESGTLLDFERFYQCVPGSLSVADRRAQIISAIRSTGELNLYYFELIAIALGYTLGVDSSAKWLQILEAVYEPFRAGFSSAGDRVYSQVTGGSYYTVQVAGTNVSTDSRLQYLFNKQVLAGVDFTFINS